MSRRTLFSYFPSKEDLVLHRITDHEGKSALNCSQRTTSGTLRKGSQSTRASLSPSLPPSTDSRFWAAAWPHSWETRASFENGRHVIAEVPQLCRGESVRELR